MKPEPITDPDFFVRAISVNDLEKTLVAFITQIVEPYRFDNPTLNLAQLAEPIAAPLIYDPDQPPVSFDPESRAQTLALKVPPQVVRGRVPRTVTGELATDKLPDFPAVIVQVISAQVNMDQTNVTVRIFVNMYDENPDSSGYQDCLNITEAIAVALTTYGQGAIDQAYPIMLPLEWELVEPDTFPHFVSQMTTKWTLPSGRPMPDLSEAVVPGEAVEFRFDSAPQSDRPEVALPYHEHD
jgi:hypothetical protein